MNNKTKLYYAILLLVVGIKVVATIFSNGLSVHHSKKIAQLQLQKQNLLQQQLRLNSELAAQTSLSQITANYDISEYVAISKPLKLTATTTVASGL